MRTARMVLSPIVGLVGLRIGLWLGVTIGAFVTNTNPSTLGPIFILLMGALFGAGLAYRNMEN